MMGNLLQVNFWFRHMVRVKRTLRSVYGFIYLLLNYRGSPKLFDAGERVILLVPGSSLENALQIVNFSSYDTVVFLNLSAAYWTEVDHPKKIVFTGDGVRLRQISNLDIPLDSIWFFPNDSLHVDSRTPLSRINWILPKYRFDWSSGLITAKKSKFQPINLMVERKSQSFGSLLLVLSFLTTPNLRELDIIGLDFGSKEGRMNPSVISKISKTYSNTPHNLIREEFKKYIEKWGIKIKPY